MYLYGKEVGRDYEKAIALSRHLRQSTGNQYAEQILHSIHSNRNWLPHLARSDSCII